jgi:hypothetical protein
MGGAYGGLRSLTSSFEKTKGWFCGVYYSLYLADGHKKPDKT